MNRVRLRPTERTGLTQPARMIADITLLEEIPVSIYLPFPPAENVSVNHKVIFFARISKFFDENKKKSEISGICVI